MLNQTFTLKVRTRGAGVDPTYTNPAAATNVAGRLEHRSSRAVETPQGTVQVRRAWLWTRSSAVATGREATDPNGDVWTITAVQQTAHGFYRCELEETSA